MPRKHKSQQSEYPKLDLPLDYAVKRGDWPEGPLVGHAPKEALLAQGIARSFRECCAKKKTNANAVARSVGLGSQTVYNLRDGKKLAQPHHHRPTRDPLQPSLMGQRTQAPPLRARS